MPGYKADYPLLYARKIIIGLRYADNDAVQAHGVYGHCGGGDDHAPLRRNGERDAYRVSPAEHEGHSRLLHSGYHLRYGKPGFHVAAHGIQKYQQRFDLRRFFNRRYERQHMLILRRFHVVRL